MTQEESHPGLHGLQNHEPETSTAYNLPGLWYSIIATGHRLAQWIFCKLCVDI